MATALKKHKHNKNADLYDDVEKIKAALSDTTFGVRNLLGDAYYQSMENVREKSAVVRGNMTDYISENPFKSVGIAAVSGLLVGILLKKK